jgi:flagellar export protein FliJ
MGFTFKYEALLSYRRHLKEQAEIEFSLCRKEVEAAQNLLETYLQHYQNTNRSFQHNLEITMTAFHIRNYADYLDRLKGMIREQVGEVTRRENLLRDKHTFLLETIKKYKVMERLKEKELRRWHIGQDRLEQKKISELAMMRHQREFP